MTVRVQIARDVLNLHPDGPAYIGRDLQRAASTRGPVDWATLSASVPDGHPELVEFRCDTL